MFDTKKQQSYTSFVKPGLSSWYSGPVEIVEDEEKKFKSWDEILKTPLSVRNADIPSDYFD